MDGYTPHTPQAKDTGTAPQVHPFPHENNGEQLTGP